VNENVFFAAFFFPAAAAVLVFFMKYLSAILQARVRLGQDEAYREIAMRAAAAQADLAVALGAIQTQLAGIEKILNSVA
jgi:chromatin segregation and condensation protein Rec8/ScpA/Scc1 (kleisin family)